MDSHPIRNGIIATVIGGVILTSVVPKLREFALKGLEWVWSGFTWAWTSIFSTYPISGWLILLVCIFACIGLLAIFFFFQEVFSSEHKKYNEDFFHGAKWRWDWVRGSISNLWCYCPDCDSELVYDDSSCSRYSRTLTYDPPHTKFICENCNRRIVSSVEGGDKYYVKGAVEREIKRRIRTSEIKL